MSIKKHLLFIYPLFVIPLLLIVIWFKNGQIVGGGDESFIFYNPQISLGILNNTWQEYQTGAPFLAWLSRADFVLFAALLQQFFALPSFFLQAASLYILMVMGVVAVYFLTSSFFRDYKESHLISLVAAIFYLFNPFSVSQVWGRGQYAQYFSFALLPLSFLLFKYGLENRKSIFIILLSFSSVFFSTAFGFVTFIVVLWVVLLAYLIYWILKSKQRKKDFIFGISFFLGTFVIWCLVSAWWLFPLVVSGNSILSGYLENSAENLSTLLGVSTNFTPDILIRLLQKTYYFDASSFSPVYKSFLFNLISFIPPIFLLIGFIKVIKEPAKSSIRFFLVLLIVGIIISLGANPPFGWLFIWLFKHINLFQSFRNPYEKFGLVYALGYSIIFAFGLVNFFGAKYKKIWIAAFLGVTCGIFAWPMWNGKVVAFPNDAPGIDVPKYYPQLNNWLLANNTEGYRIFMTPVWPGDGAFYQWGKTKYNGMDPMMFLLNSSVVSSIPNIPYYYDFIQNIRKLSETTNVAPALGLLRIKYLINREDAITLEKEKQQRIVFTEAIFPSQNISGNEEGYCQNLHAGIKTNGAAWLACRMPPEKSDWSKDRYLHVTVKTDSAAYIELALTDQNLKRIRWDGRSPLGVEYQTNSREWTTITFPLNSPTEYNNNMDFSKILGIEVLAHSLNDPKLSANEIFLEQVSLDPGEEKKTNAFSLVNTFGKLQVYAPNYFNTPEEFGALKQISLIGNFTELFKQAEKEADLINQKGFILQSQNSHQKLSNIITASSKIVNKQKFSNTRYWLELDNSNKDALLLLSKTYNPEWKVIPNISKEALNGNFFNDLKLLKSQVLPEKDHLVVNGYANLWQADSTDTKYAIVFMPQVIADIGFKISLFSIMFLAGITILWKSKKYISSR